ncbi:alcohol dehydrogenase [Lachnellula suecica]|uniref:Alcohol dehydrogenase n=1 Tax=Lachnellula suecica TaxID=602035 RepID=A0A8T9BY12_9HELO|nr:alcohol dehydrogenase [Lachnellula suecica]
MTSATSKLPRLMKAQFLDAFKTPYNLRSVPLPTLTSPDNLLIKVDAASYCHTDAVLAEGLMLPNPPAFPHIGCHEFAGTIVCLLPTSNTSFRIGDRVGVPGRAFHPCGTCFECLDDKSPNSDPAGYSILCPSSHNNGLSRHGGFAEFAVVDARQVAPIPASLSAVETAPLMCAGVTIYAALKRCSLKPGQRVGIIGCGGGLGHLGLQFARKMGFKVIGCDSADGPLNLARDLNTGATIVDVRLKEAHEIVKQLGAEDGISDVRGESGLDAVIILPESQKALDYGISLLKNHGNCVVVSFPDTGFHLSARDIVFRDISIVGSLVGSNKTLREMLEFAAEHQVRAIVKRFPLSDLNGLVDDYYLGRGGKLVIDMSLEN